MIWSAILLKICDFRFVTEDFLSSNMNYRDKMSVIDKKETTQNHQNPPETTQKLPESSPDIMYTDPKGNPSTQTGPITAITQDEQASFELRRFLVWECVQ